MSTSEPETSVQNSPRMPLRADEFLTFDELMERLPPKTTREAIRKLVKERGLKVHRIGLHRMFWVQEVIVASAVGGDDLED